MNAAVTLPLAKLVRIARVLRSEGDYLVFALVSRRWGPQVALSMN